MSESTSLSTTPETPTPPPVCYPFSDTVYGRSFMTSLLTLRQNGHFTDVTLCAGDELITCHKVVLSAASPYFYAMFNCGLEESTSDVVQIKGVDAETLVLIVDYIYSTDIKITTSNVQSLIQACEHFHFTQLKQACERFMLQQVDSSNCVGFYRFAKLYQLKTLRDGARRCMTTMFKQVVSGSEFRDMMADEIIEYIDDCQLDVRTEDPVFEAVALWIRHALDERSDDVTRVLSHVRFPFCTSAYLCHVVGQDELLRAPSASEPLLEEARRYHMLPDRRHEMRGPRTVPRRSFGVSRRLVLVGGLTKHDKENRFCWYLREEDMGSWELLAQLPKPSWKFYSLCAVQQGLVVSGGYHGTVKRECWLFDTVEKKWKTLVAMCDGRCKHRSVVHGDLMYVVGGEDDLDDPLASVERYDPRSRRWNKLPDMPKALSDPLLVSFGRHVYVFGGIERDDATSVSTSAFDTVWETWSSRAEMPEPCRLGAATTVGDKIYMVGGYSRSCLSYDPLNNQWTSLTRPAEKHGNAPAVVWHGRILVGGGDVDMNETTSNVEEYQPENDTWSYWKLPLKEELSCHYMLNVELPGV